MSERDRWGEIVLSTVDVGPPDRVGLARHEDIGYERRVKLFVDYDELTAVEARGLAQWLMRMADELEVGDTT